jgi:excisionase family DNA binding protein
MREQPFFCSVLEAARLLGIGRSGIYLLMSNNALRSVKHGKRRLIERASIAAYAASLPESPLQLSPKAEAQSC